MKENNVKHIFVVYRDAFYRRFPEFSDRVKWFPHFVNTDIFKDYGLKKDIDWLMMGKLAFYYPLRVSMYETMKDMPGFVYHKHPGYRDVNDNEETEVFVGERYAREINRAKMFLTDGTYHDYPIIKYYEVLACKTLLLAPASQELADLGFIPGVHFVAVNEDNFLERALYYLKHEEERQKIAEQGYRMVHEKHSVAVRAAQLGDMIRDITIYHSNPSDIRE